jgi:hypothetical protein
MNALQMWMLAGVLVMGGVASLVWWLAPAQPDLGDVLERLSPAAPARQRQVVDVQATELSDKAGLWAMKHLPAAVWAKTPTKDLALLGKPVHVFYGEKVLFGGLAVVAVPLLAGLFSMTFAIPLYIPTAVTIAAAGLAWFLPHQNVADAAKEARVEFGRALGSYVDLVALERNAGGSGTRQALENAAEVGDSWQFRRIADELARSRFAGVAPWDALHELADELSLPDLDDLADIMRLSGEEGTQVYDTLRARSSALRTAMLTNEQARANAIGERMTMPTAAMAMVFVAILLTPAVLRLMAG